MSAKQYGMICFSGLLLATHYVFWFESLNYTSVASSTAIVTLQPVFAVIAGYIFFRERVNRVGIIGIGLAILASCYIGWQDFQHNSLALYGDALALLAAFLITGYFYLGKNLRSSINLIVYSIVGYFSSSVMLLLYGLFQKHPFTGYSSFTWLMFVSMAFFSTILGQMLINWLLKWMSATTVSVAILSEVIWATILSLIVLGEYVSSKQIQGICVIMIGLLLYSYRDKIGKRS